MPFEALLVLLFTVATAVALAVRWLRVPYTVALVVAGLLLGTSSSLHVPHLSKDLLYAVFLPGLLFEAAFHLDFRKFWQNRLAIMVLAIPGVIVAILLTASVLTPVAAALHFVSGFSFQHGLVFAALLAATDPIAVVALFKSLGVPKRLAVLVEGESLLNDGTAVVLFTLVLAFVSGRDVSLATAALDFVRVVGVGLAIGLLIGYAASKVTQQIDDPMIEITLTTIAAYGSFTAAEQLHYSGVIATVAAGMMCGNFGARTGMSPTTRIAVESFWEYIAFALNSLVFLLIGFEVHIDALLASWQAILAAYVAMTLGRAAVIALVTVGLRRTRERMPWSWAAVLTWGGLRGGLSMVLALALPQGFPHRELLVTMTFGAVLLSILLQGLTMSPLLRRLGLVGAKEGRAAYDATRGALRAAQAALRSLDVMEREGFAHKELLAETRADYERRVREAQGGMEALHLEIRELLEEERHALRRQLLTAEKDELLRAFREGVIGQEALDRLIEDVDERLVGLERAVHAGEEPPAE